jgi:hypothetical protein
MDKQTQWTLLDDIGGEPLEGSGFEGETPTFDRELDLGTDAEDDKQ